MTGTGFLTQETIGYSSKLEKICYLYLASENPWYHPVNFVSVMPFSLHVLLSPSTLLTTDLFPVYTFTRITYKMELYNIVFEIGFFHLTSMQLRLAYIFYVVSLFPFIAEHSILWIELDKSFNLKTLAFL